MSNIKNYKEFIESNESIVTTLSSMSILIGLLRIYKTYNFAIKDSTKDVELMQEIKDICGKSPEIYCFKYQPKKLTKSPAFATINKIFYSSKLKEQLTHRELLAVLLHETSHIKSKDAIKSSILQIFPRIPALILDSWLVFLLLPIFSTIFIKNPISRGDEFGADSFASKYGYGKDLSSGLIKVNHNLQSDTNTRKEKSTELELVLKLFNTHPSLIDRIKNLCKKEDPEEFINRIQKEIEDNELEEENIINLIDPPRVSPKDENINT